MALILFLLVVLTACIAHTITRIERTLRTMPTLDDLRVVAADVKIAVEDAAQRVINSQDNAIPQDIIDGLNDTKAKADSIAP
jgi:hypothetical protein